MKAASNECPIVTIVTVALNCEELIEQTINSVRVQDYRNKEFIVIDGGSCDNTVNLIRENIDCVTKYVTEKDEGIYDAMNKGIQLANSRSEFITFLNAGDVFSDERVIKDVVSSLTTPQSHIYGNIIKDGELINVSNKINQYVLSTNMVCHQAFFFNTKIHKNHLYDKKYRICADYKLLIELVNAGEKFQKINRSIVNFDTSGVSHTNREKLHAENDLIRKEYLKIYVYHFLKTNIKKLLAQ